MRTTQTVLVLAGLLLCAAPCWSQTTFVVDTASTFSVTGTSTLHDWTAEAGTIEGEVVLDASFTEGEMPAEGATVSQAMIRVPVNSLDGGRGNTMNGKIRKAFTSSEHPDIVYELESAAITSTGEAGFTLQATGTLMMAGTERPLEMQLQGHKRADGGFAFTGEQPLKMTDFEMEPPTAMFGQIVAGDEVTVNFTLVVSATSS